MENFIDTERVLEIFKEFSAIPHGSGNTSGVADYCIGVAKKLSLEYVRDSIGNVIIYKPACGCDKKEPVIMQGHLDMVCEKRADKNIDFIKEGITVCREGDFIFADGTTLGGDDGIAVAIILAILEDNTLTHPPIEAVFTVDEETGMDGATALDTSLLKGKTMLNLDSEDEDTLWVSCAGGARVNIDLPVARKANAATGTAFKITLSGLLGGHSGTEIDKHRINAVHALTVFLQNLINNTSASLVSFAGGLMDNAIPREASATVTGVDEAVLCAFADEYAAQLKKAYPNETALVLSAEPEKGCSRASLTNESALAVLSLVSSCPDGVIKMSEKIKGLVQTSLNLGIMKLESANFHISFSVRSSVNSEKSELMLELEKAALAHGASYASSGAYPAWEYNEVSPLRDVISQEYEKLTGKKCEVKAIHAGLECGIFYDKIKGLDCVSMGPNILDIHTPDERLSVSSVERVCALLSRTLESL